MSEQRTGPTALVLAGGGAKGSFEAGALQYLVGEERIVPQIITATSAGAIAATVLAQARTLDEFVQRVDEIEQDLLAMTDTAAVFGQQGWLKALNGTTLATTLEFAMTEGTRPPFPRRQTPAEPIGPDGPTRAQRRAAARARRQRQRRLFRLASGASWRLPKVRRQLRTSGSSILNLDPLASAMRNGGPTGIKPVDQSLINRPGLQLRLAVTALRAGVLRYVTEDGTLVEDDAMTPAPVAAAGPVDVIEGAMASASVPLVFPPRSLADDDYVDGGVLQVIPVRAAMQLGATRIFAIVALPLALDRDERNYAQSSAAQIGIRAMAMISMADRQKENLQTPLPADTSLSVIDPVVDVVGMFEIEQGLLRINTAYGWLRAADVLAVGDAELITTTAGQTHEIVQARVDAWNVEERLWASAPGDDIAGDLAIVRQHKEHIRDLMDQRKQLGFPVPDGCGIWWTEYENHSTGPVPAHLPPLS